MPTIIQKSTRPVPPEQLRFFQAASLASRENPVVLRFETLASAQAARAELNAERKKLKDGNSDYYPPLRDVVLRLVAGEAGDYEIHAHIRENAPLRAALSAAGFVGEADEEEIGDTYLDNLLK